MVFLSLNITCNTQSMSIRKKTQKKTTFHQLWHYRKTGCSAMYDCRSVCRPSIEGAVVGGVSGPLQEDSR